MKQPLIDDLEYICTMSFNIFKIPIYLLTKEGKLVFEPSSGYWRSHPFLLKEDILNQLFTEDHTVLKPLFSEVAYLENFFSVNINSCEQFNGKIIVGPVLFGKVPEESIQGVANDLQLKINTEEMRDYYSSLPIVRKLDFIHISIALYYMLYEQKLDVVDIHQANLTSQIERPDIYLSNERQKDIVKRDLLLEQRLFQCIKEGKIEELNTVRSQLKELDAAILSKASYLRNIKNLIISGISLATRAAIDGGLNPEIAFALSNLYIQNLEELDNIKDINNLTDTAFFEFTERVQRGKKHRYSKPINMCQNHIYTHLYEDITVPKLAELVKMNPNYLSNMFKKEVGLSIIEYIHHAKVDEAKSLIMYSNQPLSEISSLLNFHDQSYFTKVFKKCTGVTPKQYKKGFIESKD